MEKNNFFKNLSYSELDFLSKEINKELELKKEEKISNLKHKLKDILKAIKEIDCMYLLVEDCNYVFDVSDLLDLINFD